MALGGVQLSLVAHAGRPDLGDTAIGIGGVASLWAWHPSVVEVAVWTRPEVSVVMMSSLWARSKSALVLGDPCASTLGAES